MGALRTNSGLMGKVVGDYVFEDDFDQGSWSATADDHGAKWLLTETGSGTQVLATDEIGGALHVTTGTSDNDSCELQAIGALFKPQLNGDLYFECRLKFTAAVAPLTTIDFFMGLATEDTAVLDGTTNAIGFRTGAVDTAPLNAGGASIIFSVGDAMGASWTASTISEFDTGSDYVDDTYITLAGRVVSNTEVYAYVDGARVGSIFTTNLPAGDVLVPTIAIQNNAAAAKQMQVDYFYAEQSR